MNGNSAMPNEAVWRFTARRPLAERCITSWKCVRSRAQTQALGLSYMWIDQFQCYKISRSHQSGIAPVSGGRRNRLYHSLCYMPGLS